MMRVAAVLVVVLMAACAGDVPDSNGDVDVSRTSTTSAAPASSTTAVSTPIVPSSTSSSTSMPDETPPAGECAGEHAPAIPSDASGRTQTTGDLDADGLTDTLSVYEQGGEWWLHAELAGGWSVRRVLNDLFEPDDDAAAVHRVVDIGVPAALIDLDHVLIGLRFGFFVLDDCELIPLLLPDGSLPVIVAGGAMVQTWWFSCSLDGVVQLAVMNDGETIDDLAPVSLERWHYAVDGTRFSLVDVTQETVAGRTLEELLAAAPRCDVPAEY